MNEATRKLAGRRFIEALVAQGVVKREDNAVRVVVDARADGVVTLYVERFADERMLVVATTLQGIEIKGVPK